MTIKQDIVQQILKLGTYKFSTEISEELNINHKTVMRYLKLHNIKRTGINPDIKDDILYRLEQNESMEFIAMFYDISLYDVNKLKKENNIQKKSEKERKYSYEYILYKANIPTNLGDLVIELSSIYNVSAISEETKISKDLVRKILKSKNIKPLKIRFAAEPTKVNLIEKYKLTNEQVQYIKKYWPHFSTNTISKELNIDSCTIAKISKYLNLQKLPKEQRLCIHCRINLCENKKSYGSSCKGCHLVKMTEYQKVYYPNKMKLKRGQSKEEILTKIFGDNNAN